MKKFLLSIALVPLFLTACSSSTNVKQETVAFYPPGGMGDVVQYESVEGAFKLPVRYTGLQNVDVKIYEVDQNSFYENAVGGFAAVEGHLDLSGFEKSELFYDQSTPIMPDPEGKTLDGMPVGYLVLPIEEDGYYYLAFDHSDLQLRQFHILLHLGEKDEFSYH